MLVRSREKIHEADDDDDGPRQRKKGRFDKTVKTAKRKGRNDLAFSLCSLTTFVHFLYSTGIGCSVFNTFEYPRSTTGGSDPVSNTPSFQPSAHALEIPQ